MGFALWVIRELAGSQERKLPNEPTAAANAL